MSWPKCTLNLLSTNQSHKLEKSLIVKGVLSAEYVNLTQNISEKSNEKEFKKKKEHPVNKFNKLMKNQKRHYELADKSTNHVKEPILNLTNEEIPDSYRSLLVHGPKLESTNNRILIMDILAST